MTEPHHGTNTIGGMSWEKKCHGFRGSRALPRFLALAAAIAAGALPSSATAAIAPSRDAPTVAGAITDALPAGGFVGASFPLIPPKPSTTPECQDGIDNDGDGTIDFTPPQTMDPGCQSATDNREQDDPLPECSNGFDDDGDGKVDFTPPPGETADPGCSSAQDIQEFDAGSEPPLACSNGFDDDGDGTIDFTPPPEETADPGCSSPQDNQELDGEPDPGPECSNGGDDDGDDKIDFTPPPGGTADPGCASAQDNQEFEGVPDPDPQCSNGFDDDGDDKIDFTPPPGGTADPGCASAQDLDEGSEGLPPGEDTDPAAVSDVPLTGFPTSGATYAIMSSGDTEFADDANESGGTSQSNGNAPGVEAHGAIVQDLVQLKIDVSVPPSANCLQVDFRFLSEEYPEYIGSSFNDGFVAELDTSDFQAATDGITAPHNFAFDSDGKVISINTAGFSDSEAAGTTYDGATALLRASTPISPGRHSIYLSVFDLSDSVLDSAAFVDNLRLITVPGGNCTRGTDSDTTAPQTTITAGPTGTIADSTPSFQFSSSEAGSTFECRVDSGAFASCSSPHTTAALSDGAHTFEVRAIDGAGNTDPTPASRTFTVDATPPETTITAGPTGTTGDSTPTFEFSSSEAGSTFECRIDTGAFASCASPLTTVALAEGEHTFEVRATDGAGNMDPSPASRAFTVDTTASETTITDDTALVVDRTPPDTVITSGPSGLTSDRTPTFRFASTEPGSSFECRLDGGGFFVCSSPFTAPRLPAGRHTFEVRAIDPAGNIDPSPASTFDATASLRNFTVARTLADLPSAVLGRRVNVEPVSGDVFVSQPPGAGATSSRGGAPTAAQVKGRTFVPLAEARQIPVGSLLDTRRGTVRLVSAADRRGNTQTGEFLSGIFQVLQSRSARAKGLTELRLKGSSFRRCRTRTSEVQLARLSRRTIRRLRANARGRFRTRGRYSAATVRGTRWSTLDRCDGTLTKVTRGRVAVRDFRRKRTIVVRAGKYHLARAPG
jgi:hypothetical protein